MKPKLTINELGAGTALPSLALLQQWLQTARGSNPDSRPGLHLTIADYNQSVLELATFPNLFLMCHQDPLAFSKQGEIDVTPEALAIFEDKLRSSKVTITALTGHWSPEFPDLLRKASDVKDQSHTIILASETVYSPDTIGPFTATLLRIMTDAAQEGGAATAYVAAKSIYFGIGGGVKEFKETLTRMGGQAQVVWQSEGLGVRRMILEVKILA